MTNKIIIDTDPGVDDVLAMILALASPELDILAITTVHGNIGLHHTTRNVLSLFNVLSKASENDTETTWAKKFFQGEAVIVAAGAATSTIPEKQLDAAYFHGKDGLGGVSDVYPEYLPASGWERAFPALVAEGSTPTMMKFPGVSASQRLAHKEILHLLESEPEDTITIVAVGPLTNLSLACTENYTAFSRVKEIVIMGGALNVPGNVTPTAEFNFLADPEAAAHLFSFSSPTPSSTWDASPKSVEKNLKITLLPLDTTTNICLSHTAWSTVARQEGLLAKWTNVFVDKTFQTMKGLYTDASIEKVNLSMHDPACIWYLLRSSESNTNNSEPSWQIAESIDIRIETEGRWTRGSCVLDLRGREKIAEGLEDVGSDTGSWLSTKTGNRINWVTSTPGSDAFVQDFLSRVFKA